MYFPHGYADACDAVANYQGGAVDRLLTEKALDFLIAAEPDDDNIVFPATATEIQNARNILRAFAVKQEPKTLENLQRLYYTFSNSTKYRWSPETISIVRIELSKSWEGLYGWRD